MTALTYRGSYCDALGREDVVFHNDSTTLTTSIRGVFFSGNDFDCLEATADVDPARLGSFALGSCGLCKCKLTIEFPIPIAFGSFMTDGILHAEIDLGAPSANGGIAHEHVTLALVFGEERIVSPGTSGGFELELLAIQKQLPDGAYLKACINCLYSDYSPYGNGVFGNMLCFRNIKDEYLRVTSKDEFWAVHRREERQVQETYLCEQFMRRVAGTGYRG